MRDGTHRQVVCHSLGRKTTTTVMVFYCTNGNIRSALGLLETHFPFVNFFFFFSAEVEGLNPGTHCCHVTLPTFECWDYENNYAAILGEEKSTSTREFWGRK